MLDTKKMIGISVADYIMEIWDYIILVNRSDYALYEQASDNDVLCDLLIWILGNDVCLAIPYTGSKGDLKAELEDFLDSQYFMSDEYV